MIFFYKVVSMNEFVFLIYFVAVKNNYKISSDTYTDNKWNIPIFDVHISLYSFTFKPLLKFFCFFFLNFSSNLHELPTISILLIFYSAILY